MKKLILTACILLTSLFKTFGQESYLDRGNALLGSGQLDKAEQVFREGIKSDSTNLIYKCQLGLVLIQQKRYSDAEIVLDRVLNTDPNNIAALWYSGIGNFYNAHDRLAIIRFSMVLTLIDKNRGQYSSANWFIGKCYSILLKTEGLTYAETDKMFACYEEYLRLQPNAKDAGQIREYVEHEKSRRPPDNVKIWVDM